MKTDSYDQRVRVTKKMIREAFLKLLSEKDINRITVRELCETSQINRGTFYTHYNDVYDLKEQIENELLAEFALAVKDTFAKAEKLNDDLIFRTVFSLLKENSELCVILLKNGANASVIDKFAQVGEKIFFQYYKQFLPSIQEEKLKIYYLFISSGCIAVLRQWMLSGMNAPIDEIAEELSEITSKGLGYLNYN